MKTASDFICLVIALFDAGATAGIYAYTKSVGLSIAFALTFCLFACFFYAIIAGIDELVKKK